MRRILISLLLAGAAASPALAAPDDYNARQAARAERAQAREERAQAREEQVKAVERAQASRPDRPSDARPQLVERAPRVDNSSRPARDFDSARAVRNGDRAQRIEQVQQNREAIRDRIDQRRELRQSSRVPPVMRNPIPVVSNTPQPGTQPPPRTDSRRTPAPQWSTNWRTNSRYDWQNYRHRHRSLFHLGFYYDPFGWGYSPYQIGWRMWPSYYGNSFWLNDPWQYRLPYAPPGTRWVRYWDDAVLVDTWTGEVVDVIYNFFW